MNYQEFVDLVYKMRDAQKDYFRTRQKVCLEKSKLLEKQVDYAVKQFKDSQLNLFNNESNN